MKRNRILALLATLIAPMVSAQADRPALQFETAEKIRDACLAHARETPYSLAIAVFDHGGQLVSFSRTRQAGPGASEFALWKGRSSALYAVPTRVSGTWSDAATGPKLATVGGGMPVFNGDGVLLGGVGVSGAPPEYDEECARVGIEATGLLAARPD